MHLLLLTRYARLGSSSRIRFYQYLPYLESHGIQVTSAPLLDDRYIRNLYTNRPQNPLAILRAYVQRLAALLHSRAFDLIWLEKEALPWVPALGEALATHFAPSCVVDYDDAAFHRYDQHRNPFVRALLGGKIDAVMRRAALVVAGNDYLAARARQAGAARLEIIPSVVDADRYRPAPPRPPAGFNIGWIGAPVTAPYLRLIQPALATLCQRSDTRLTLVGAGRLAMEGVPLESRPWREATEVNELQQFDVGIMPLPDEPFERGKCGYKLIQYMACGLPVVASPVGVNRQIVEHGVNGFLANTPDEWVAALSALRDDPALRRQMGAAGRAKVETQYSLQVTAPRLRALLLATSN